jgi:hypothetical protein
MFSTLLAEWTGQQPVPVIRSFLISYKFAMVAIPEFSTNNLQQFNS